MATAEINHREIVRNYLQAQPNLAEVDAQAAAKQLNREFSLRGGDRIEPQSIIAHKAVLAREANQGDAQVDEVKLDASQRKIITQLLKGMDPADAASSLRAWGKRIEAAGGLDKALERLTREATLISSLGDDPKAAIAALLAQANK